MNILIRLQELCLLIIITLYESLNENILGPYLEKLILFECRKLKIKKCFQRYVKELVLSPCPKVRDVRGLGKVHKLSIGGSPREPNVTFGGEALCNVHDLELQNCTIIDLSPFSNINTLYLSKCPTVTDVSALSNVSILYLADFPLVTDISALNTVKDLNIWFFPLITDISALSTVPKLRIGFCHGITDVSALHTVQDLTLVNLGNIADVSILSSVPKLTIKVCVKITNWGSITHQEEEEEEEEEEEGEEWYLYI